MQYAISTEQFKERYKNMKKFSMDLLIKTVKAQRDAHNFSQKDLAIKSGMNRTMVCHMESGEYTPSIKQIQDLAEVLDFDVTELFTEEKTADPDDQEPSHRIAVAGTGYVGR